MKILTHFVDWKTTHLIVTRILDFQSLPERPSLDHPPFYENAVEVMIIFYSGSDEDSCDSRAYLKDLVETTHLFLRMLEKFTKTNNHLIVQAKKRKCRKKAKKGIGGRFLCLCAWIFSCFSGIVVKND